MARNKKRANTPARTGFKNSFNRQAFPLQIKDGKFQIRTLILSDLHIFTDQCQAKNLCRLLQNADIKNLILAGDVFDGEAAARDGEWAYKNDWQKQLVEELFKHANNAETNTTYVVGNHDEFLRGQLVVPKNYTDNQVHQYVQDLYKDDPIAASIEAKLPVSVKRDKNCHAPSFENRYIDKKLFGMDVKNYDVLTTKKYKGFLISHGDALDAFLRDPDKPWAYCVSDKIIENLYKLDKALKNIGNNEEISSLRSTIKTLQKKIRTSHEKHSGTLTNAALMLEEIDQVRQFAGHIIGHSHLEGTSFVRKAGNNYKKARTVINTGSSTQIGVQCVFEDDKDALYNAIFNKRGVKILPVKDAKTDFQKRKGEHKSRKGALKKDNVDLQARQLGWSYRWKDITANSAPNKATLGNTYIHAYQVLSFLKDTFSIATIKDMHSEQIKASAPMKPPKGHDTTSVIDSYYPPPKHALT